MQNVLHEQGNPWHPYARSTLFESPNTVAACKVRHGICQNTEAQGANHKCLQNERRKILSNAFKNPPEFCPIKFYEHAYHTRTTYTAQNMPKVWAGFRVLLQRLRHGYVQIRQKSQMHTLMKGCSSPGSKLTQKEILSAEGDQENFDLRLLRSTTPFFEGEDDYPTTKAKTHPSSLGRGSTISLNGKITHPSPAKKFVLRQSP